jgi:hypothetical protein
VKREKASRKERRGKRRVESKKRDGQKEKERKRQKGEKRPQHNFREKNFPLFRPLLKTSSSPFLPSFPIVKKKQC